MPQLVLYQQPCTQFLQTFVRPVKFPPTGKNGILTALYKGKEPKTKRGSYRPITLLSVPGKVFAHVVLARIQPFLDITRRPEQSGFVAGRSTIDAVLALRLLLEIHREFDRPLNVVYFDIKAAFDSVDRAALWKALRGREISDVLLGLIIALHENTSVRARLGKQLSDPLLTTSGVRPGCVLALALFCVAIDWILRHMKTRPGITVGRDLFTDLVYADDTGFFVKLPASAATCLSSFSETASVLGFHVSWPKTKTPNLGSGPYLTQYLSMKTTYMLFLTLYIWEALSHLTSSLVWTYGDALAWLPQ